MTLGVLAGLVLPVPLILLSSVAAREERQGHLPGGARVSPTLSYEEQLKRETFLRSCSRSDECEPPLGCLNYARIRQPICYASECVTDMQCPEGETCQVLPSEGHGPRIRMCIQQGERQEGEECDIFPLNKKEACGAGLFCRERRCSRPCQTEEAESCPAGFFCADNPEGAVCLPTCEERGCPEGQQCVQFNKAGPRHVSACVKVRGENCQQTPCAQGQKCMMRHGPEHPGEVQMYCATLCDRGRPPCPDGLICHLLFCRQPCDPQVPGACGPERECQQIRSNGPWVCPLE